MVNIQRLPMPLMDSYDWQYDGLCRNVDPDEFFSPEAERGAAKLRREEAAKEMCFRCPVIDTCREHALSVQEPYGVWGGLSESERTAIIAERKRGAKVA